MSDAVASVPYVKSNQNGGVTLLTGLSRSLVPVISTVAQLRTTAAHKTINLLHLIQMLTISPISLDMQTAGKIRLGQKDHQH